MTLRPQPLGSQASFTNPVYLCIFQGGAGMHGLQRARLRDVADRLPALDHGQIDDPRPWRAPKITVSSVWSRNAVRQGSTRGITGSYQAMASARSTSVRVG